MKRLVGTELQEVSGVGEKLLHAERELRIEAVLQFMHRHSKDLGTARDDGVGEGRELRDGFGGIGVIGGVGVGRRRFAPMEKRFQRVVMVLQDVLPHSLHYYSILFYLLIR